MLAPLAMSQIMWVPGYQGTVILCPKGAQDTGSQHVETVCRYLSPLEEHPVLLATGPPFQPAEPFFSWQCRINPLLPLLFLVQDKVPSLQVEPL